MSIPRIILDQAAGPAQRIKLSSEQQRQAKELVDFYVEDIGMEIMESSSWVTALENMDQNYHEEASALASLIGCSTEEILLVTLYYDMFKVMMGCSAFAVDTEDGPLLARNLDWWTENKILSRYSTMVEYLASETMFGFKSVAWPGYIGVLSGVAFGRFAVTLNAVLSEEKPGEENAIVLLLRDVLASAPTYTAAVDILASADIISDCLLLVAGVEKGEMCVIERTPTQSAIRHPQNGFITVTNDYKVLNGSSVNQSELESTSCSRFNRLEKLLSSQQIVAVDDCFDLLRDTDVKMEITVQHMVMSAKTGDLQIQLP